jgi:uracil-DNA glycosylase
MNEQVTEENNAAVRPIIEPSWYARLAPEFEAPYFLALKRFLIEERKLHKVYPAGVDMFRAFSLTPFDQVRVVILGQDPYHGPGQAHGLCFSVPKGTPLPPSLRNIFQELERDLGGPSHDHGDLTAWAQQGVLLLNTILSVRENEAASHQGHGWENFTDAAISALARERKGLVFMLWGRHAQLKATLIDEDHHYVLRAPHPSPLSAHKGFIGCGHFSAANDLLVAQGGPPVRWTS